MSKSTRNPWAPAKPVEELSAKDLESSGLVFSHDRFLYRTTGKKLGTGGMGSVYLMARQEGDETPVPVVGKVFHSDYLLQLQTDSLAQGEHDQVMHSVQAISTIDHPHLLPTYLSKEISDNYLFISPLRSETLREVVANSRLNLHQRVHLLTQAMEGLQALHSQGYLHRDFTLRNILVNSDYTTAYLFDFDLVLSLNAVREVSYKSRFQGRIFGSPGYSLAPEILDKDLMTLPIGKSLDMYALGTSIFALFTEDLPYGDADDLWSLLLRVSKGVVRGGRSYIEYPSSVPQVLYPIIEHCMQRTPSLRPQSVTEVIEELRRILPTLKLARRRVTLQASQTIGYGDSSSRLKQVQSSSPASANKVSAIDGVLKQHGYILQRAAGSVRGREIFVAEPDPHLVASGQFPDGNLYPKVVTVLDYSQEDDPQRFVSKWLGTYQSALRKARRGLMTTLHKIFHSEDSNLLLILSEHVEGARFGGALDAEDLDLHEAFGLGFLLAKQVAALHDNGLAHNNVCSESLLLKPVHENYCVHPAMVGIVGPSQNPKHMQNDARRLAALIFSWICNTQIADAAPLGQTKLKVLQSELETIATRSAPCELSVVTELCKDGLATLDFNFGVLREHGGDLETYALVRIGHSLYARLWHS